MADVMAVPMVDDELDFDFVARFDDPDEGDDWEDEIDSDWEEEEEEDDDWEEEEDDDWEEEEDDDWDEDTDWEDN